MWRTHERPLSKYDFHAVETSALSPSPVTFMFSLDTATAYVGPSGSTNFNNVSITENGTEIPGNTIGAQYGTDLGGPLFFLIDTSSQPFYTGSGTGITFNASTFRIADGATDGEGTLTISTSMSSPIPEPATWSLLLTGCSAAASVRRISRRSIASGGSAA